MSKNIAVCSDGTGNTAIKNRGSNVFKLYESVDINGHKNDPNLTPQVTIYDDGVGTESNKRLKIAGGAFGWGLSRNIRQLYAELSRVYKPDDNIYLFGFSRGAYTVRMLAGFILTFGLLKLQENEDKFTRFVKKAYSIYYRKYLYNEDDIEKFKQGEGQDKFQIASIKFIGVWDTVDAVGLPFDEATNLLNLILRFRFKNNKLGGSVSRACHALAMDDERRTFHPVLWDEESNEDGRIEQVWFPGAHANVGGGYQKQGISLVSLDWMMEKAEKDGLRFMERERKLYRERQNINDKLYNSRAGLSVFYRYKPRNITELCLQAKTTPKIHISTIERILQGTEGYAPGNFPGNFEIVSTKSDNSAPEKFKETIQDALGKNDSLLKKHESLVKCRVWSYYGVLIFSLLAIGGYLWESGSLKTLEKLSSFDGLKGFSNYLIDRLWIPIGWVISVAIGLLASRGMKKKFTGFWYPILKKLN